MNIEPNLAWEQWVGEQTPDEFWNLAQEKGAKTYYEAAAVYVDWAVDHVFELNAQTDRGDIAKALAQYLQQNL